MSPSQPPAQVASLAANRALSSLLVAQKGSNPIANFLTAVIAAVALFALALFIGWLGSNVLNFRALRFVGLFVCALGVGAIIMAFIALASGFTGAYLYSNGLIYAKNRRAEAITWPEVRELRLHRQAGPVSLGGLVLSYQLITHDGRAIDIEAVREKGGTQPGEPLVGRAVLGDQLVAIMQTLGKPIIESNPRPTF